jgi:FSR family fosmidomycin resistance protein-like MFS transporter
LVGREGSTTISQRRCGIEPRTIYAVLLALSFSHFLNDMLQSLLPAVYPILKIKFELSFTQIGLITLTFQVTASLLQPLVGLYTDRHPKPYSLAIGMGFTLAGLVLLSQAGSFPVILLAAGLVGVGSSVFHPESSRVARLASGGRHGLAQSLFQVGGNAGGAAGPLLAAFLVVPGGQARIAWFALAALLAIVVLFGVGSWYLNYLSAQSVLAFTGAGAGRLVRSRITIGKALAILLCLIFSKYCYLVSLGSYYTFYLIERFHLSVQQAQIYLFLFLGAVAAGTIAGGPIGDRLGFKSVIWCSILGVLPFTLVLPYADLFWTAILSVLIGLLLASAFPAILVYAQELVPRRVGLVAGLFFGLAFGMAGLCGAVLGELADRTSIEYVYRVCSFLPAIGILTGFLPNLDTTRLPAKTRTSRAQPVT